MSDQKATITKEDYQMVKDYLNNIPYWWDLIDKDRLNLNGNYTITDLRAFVTYMMVEDGQVIVTD